MTFNPSLRPPPKLPSQMDDLYRWLKDLREYTTGWFVKQRALGDGLEYDDLDRVTVSDDVSGACCPTLLPAYDLGLVTDTATVAEDYGAVAAPVTTVVDLGSVAS